MDLVTLFFGFLRDVFLNLAINPAIQLFPLYLGSAALIAYGVYRLSSVSEKKFLQWLLPRSIYFHPSHIVDLKLFIFRGVLTTLGAFGAVAFATSATFETVYLLTVLTGKTPSTDTWGPGYTVLAAISFFLILDFGGYWVHRCHHELSALWPFHAVHHSAEVLSPVTVYRKHPIYDLIGTGFASLLSGSLLGVFVFFFFGQVTVLTVGGINACYFAFNILGANLRHSHIWLDYGPVLDRILISPAQHQVHHSIDCRHRDKNYGEVLAIWDWIFGTLYVPQGKEELVFGLADDAGQLIKQPHPSLTAALIRPFIDSTAAIVKPIGKLTGSTAAMMKRVSRRKNTLRISYPP
jgi:sterol desaturase/sphingolipid hydroxylase (fatty acid hydroxylase superfamily)